MVPLVLTHSQVCNQVASCVLLGTEHWGCPPILKSRWVGSFGRLQLFRKVFFSICCRGFSCPCKESFRSVKPIAKHRTQIRALPKRELVGRVPCSFCARSGKTAKPTWIGQPVLLFCWVCGSGKWDLFCGPNQRCNSTLQRLSILEKTAPSSLARVMQHPATFNTRRTYICWLGPPVVSFYTFFSGEGSPTRIDYRKKSGTLILTSKIWRTKLVGLVGLRSIIFLSMDQGRSCRGRWSRFHQPGRPGGGSIHLPRLRPPGAKMFFCSVRRARGVGFR